MNQARIVLDGGPLTRGDVVAIATATVELELGATARTRIATAAEPAPRAAH